jgi:hypothetical protein
VSNGLARDSRSPERDMSRGPLLDETDVRAAIHAGLLDNMEGPACRIA